MRVILQYVLPFLLPTLCYLLWVWYATRQSKAKGTAAPQLADGPWPWLIGSGAALVIAMLATIAIMSGDAPDAGVYQAPRYEDGKIIPPSFE